MTLHTFICNRMTLFKRIKF